MQRKKPPPRRLVDEGDHQGRQLLPAPEGIGLWQETGYAQARLLGVIERTVENEFGAAGQPHLGDKVGEAIVHRQGGRGEDPGHLGALHLGTEALGDRQRRQIEGKVQTRTVIPVGETGLVDRQHLPKAGTQLADALETMIQLLPSPERQFQHFITEPDGIVEAGQRLGPEGLSQQIPGVAAPPLHAEGKAQILTGNGEPVRRLAKLGHVMSLCPVGELDILRQILDGATAHGLAEVVAGDLGQLVAARVSSARKNGVICWTAQAPWLR